MISTSAVLLRRLTLFDDTLKNLRSGLDKGPIIEKRYPVSIMANSSVINLLSGEPGWETRNFDAELQKFQEKNIKEEEIAKIFGVGKSELPLKKRMMRDMVRKLMEMAGENIQKKK